MVAEFTTYCAICSCPFNGTEIGPDTPRALKLRRARIVRRKYWEEKDCPWDETDYEEEEGRQERKRYMATVLPEGDELLDDTDDANSVSSFHYKYSYDPRIIPDDDLAWLSSPFAVGIDDRKPDEKRYFIELFQYDDRHYFDLVNDENDPELPENGKRFYGYGVSDLPDPPIFPFHWECFDLLARAVKVDSTDSIRKDVLYHVMHDIKNFVNLDLDYGKMNGADQDWQCIPGEEYSVMDHTLPIEIAKYIPDRVQNGFKTANLPDLSKKVITDPFKGLPHEIIHHILGYLPTKSLLTLSQASWVIQTHHHNTFWKKRIYQDMAWIWEVHEYIESNQGEEPDYKALYLWLDNETTATYGMTGPFLSVTNRRRIWGPCAELADRYHKKLLEQLEGKK